MARKRKIESSGRTILIIDDNLEYLESARRILERDGHRVLTVPGGREALELLRQSRVDLVLVDYFMPGMTGEEFVIELRRFDGLAQVILQTGYASEQPPRELLRRLDIQGYHDKTEGHDKLSLWVDVGLKAAYTLQLLQKSRLALRYILDVTPELHRIQALDDLLQGILLQTTGLLGAVDSFLAVIEPPPVATSGFVALVHDGEITVRAATGRFRAQAALDPQRVALLQHALSNPTASYDDDGTVVPLRIGDLVLGAIYLDRTAIESSDAEIVEIFANQAAVAIQNVQLYEGAAVDPLTGAFTRRFFDQALIRDLRTAYRNGTPLGLLMIDLDAMKNINDSYGHVAGDRALTTTGELLRRATRANDIIGRYGGDEFGVLLPGADLVGTGVVSARVAAALRGFEIETPNDAFEISGSIGAAVLLPPSKRFDRCSREQAFFERVAEGLIHAADKNLYERKGSPELIVRAERVEWPLEPQELELQAVSGPP